MSSHGMRPAPPTYADFFSEIRTLYDRLEELRAIDDTLDGFDAVENDGDCVQNEDLGGGPAGLRSETLGTTYPFPIVVQRCVTPERADAIKSQARSAAQSWAADARQALLTRLDPWISAHSHYYQTAFDGLDRAARQVAFVSDDFAELETTIGDWEGDAAENFGTNFCGRTQAVRSRQLYVISAMQCTLRAAEALTHMALHSLMNAVEAANKCADAQLRCRAASNRGTSVADFLEFAAAAAGLTSIVSFPSAPVSAAFAFVSTSLGYAASHIPEDHHQSAVITASSAAEIDCDMHSTITRVREASTDQFSRLEGEVDVIEQSIGDFEREDKWFTKSPRLVEGVPGSDFYHESSSRNA